MNKPTKTLIPLKGEFEENRPLYALTVGEFRQLLRNEIARESNTETAAEPDLIDAVAAAQLLNVSKEWIYHHTNELLPFRRKLGPRTLRFSQTGLRQWKEAKKG